jgi:hypothetical protein
VCPWNIRFAKELPNESPYAPREALGTKDGRTLAREVLAMDVEDYRAALKGSPMKRAKLQAMKRNAPRELLIPGSAPALALNVDQRHASGRCGRNRCSGSASDAAAPRAARAAASFVSARRPVGPDPPGCAYVERGAGTRLPSPCRPPPPARHA